MKSKRRGGLKTVAAFVAAAITATGMAGTAQAVALNPDGLGQVLIYPYYTVRANADGNAYDSLFTVVNAKDVAKAVRVRFREGKFGHEVMDFNLYLSAHDVWTAAITQSPDGNGAMIRTWDTSCIFPVIPANGWPFRHLARNIDQEDQTLDRTKEGYVEIIEMGDFARDWVNPITGVTHPITPTERDITHANVDGAWRPPNCNSIRNAAMQTAVDQGQLAQGTGGLFGNMTLINVNTAHAVGYDAVALSGFYKGGDGMPDTLWYWLDLEKPHLGMAYPPTSTVIDNEGNAVESTWADGLDAVSSVLMRSAIINEFNVAEVYAGATDWVITMPTKPLYFDRYRSTLVWAPRKLFQSEFRAGGAPDDVARAWVYDREKRGHSLNCYDYSDHFLIPINCDQRPHLGWATNVLQFQQYRYEDRGVLHSANRSANPWASAVSVGPDSEGWAQINIEQGSDLRWDIAGESHTYEYHTLTAVEPAGRTFTGLPVVGFAATLYNNAGVDGGSLGRVWASYVATVPHRYERNIQ